MERRSEYMVLRNVFSFCLWDIPAAVLLLALMIFFIWRHYKYKEQIRELRNQISELYAEDMLGNRAINYEKQTQGKEVSDIG